MNVGAQMSPRRNDGLPPAKEVVGESFIMRPIETQKVIPLKSNCTGGNSLVGKPTLGSPIQGKRNAGGDVLKKHSGQGIIFMRVFVLFLFLKTFK